LSCADLVEAQADLCGTDLYGRIRLSPPAGDAGTGACTPVTGRCARIFGCTSAGIRQACPVIFK
jgi:hypothetical protein